MNDLVLDGLTKRFGADPGRPAVGAAAIGLTIYAAVFAGAGIAVTTRRDVVS